MELAKKGEKIRATYRSKESIAKTRRVFHAFDVAHLFDSIEWFQCDLLDVDSLDEAFIGIEQVYHSAAVVSFRKDDASSMIHTNVEGTSNMVNLALQHEVKKFCFVSSVAALGKYRDGSCADEDTLWQKEELTSPYSISKFYSENEVWRASEEGLDVVIVNPSTIIGFGDWNQSSNSLFKRIEEGLPFYTAGRTGFVAVEDVVRAMIGLMESEIINERFVLSSEDVYFKDLFRMIAISLKKKIPSIPLRKWQAMTYAYLLSFLSFFSRKSPKITISNVHSAFNDRCFNSKKITEAIDFDFEKIEDAVKRSGELYQKYY